MRPDPIGQIGDINLFVYAKNNPVNLIDPLGLVDLNLHDPNSIHYKVAEEYSSPFGFYTVGGHGNPSSIEKYNYETGLLESPTASELVDLMLVEGYKGQNVELLSCETGKGPNSFAQQLADELKAKGYDVIVYAPTGIYKQKSFPFFGRRIVYKRWVDNGVFMPFFGRP